MSSNLTRSCVARCTTSSKGYAMMRNVKLSEGNSNKVVMWTGGSYEYDDVIRALLRLDRPEIQPGNTPHKATRRCESRENQDQCGLTRDDIKRCDQLEIDKKSTSANKNILRHARERFRNAYKSHADKINQELLRNPPTYGLPVQLLDQRTTQRDLKPDS